MKNRNLNHKDDWATPIAFYQALDSEFHFDFDPCPLHASFNGLARPWGKRNFINPPYSQKLKEEFVIKAIREAQRGALCVMLLPVSTSTALFHNWIRPNAKEIRFLRGRLKFGGYNAKGEPVNLPIKGSKKTGQHDSMVVIFKI